MKRITVLALLWTLMAGIASADGVYILEEGLELSARQVRFSLAGAGSITVRPCRDCARKSLPLSAGTEFYINGEPTERNRCDELSRLGGELYVFYDTQTGSVTRMRLKMRSGTERRSRR